ncbi:cytochrome P450 [Streptomyces sp. NPDC098789]|uniref:cytochrome P450 n=1 Tax=Streptomyces sp. NPDC098789 TaxID=3366098 RepID=UPI0037FBFEDD
MLSSDGIDHVRLRGLAKPFLTPRAVAQYGPAVNRSVEDALNRFARAGGGDLVSGLVLPVATATVARLLGQPVEQAQRLVALSLRLSDAAHPDEPGMRAAAVAMNKRLTALLAWARRDPGDNLTTALLIAHRDGAVSTAELLGSLSFILFAAVDSTLATVTTAAMHLLSSEYREARRALALGTKDAPFIVDDVIRLAAPFTYGAWRFASEPLQLGGYVVDAGQLVVLAFPVANVDPSRWPRAWHVMADRPGTARHVSFGYGPHFCPGAGLGHLQVRHVLHNLFHRFPRIRLAADVSALAWQGSIARRAAALPVLIG